MVSLSVVDVMNDTPDERTITMTAQPTTTALAVDCPKCAAEAGSPCLTSTGKKSPIHTDRVKAAAEAKPAKRAMSSHADCDHPSTKAARAACRRERAKAAAA